MTDNGIEPGVNEFLPVLYFDYPGRIPVLEHDNDEHNIAAYHDEKGYKYDPQRYIRPVISEIQSRNDVSTYKEDQG